MKTLIDGTEVSARSYYYLLDFNEKDEHEYIYSNFNKLRLCDLNRSEYKKFFEYATMSELI